MGYYAATTFVDLTKTTAQEIRRTTPRKYDANSYPQSLRQR